jgi:hypothetical protein
MPTVGLKMKIKKTEAVVKTVLGIIVLNLGEIPKMQSKFIYF